MVERNLCKKYGCKAACCANIKGCVPGRPEFFLKAFPMAQKVENEEELSFKIKNQEAGVYYFEDRSWVYFAVSGVCPNLGEDLDCKIHGERFYPRACINMIVGSDSCEDARILFPINQAIAEFAGGLPASEEGQQL